MSAPFFPRTGTTSPVDRGPPVEPGAVLDALRAVARTFGHLADLAYAARLVALPGLGTVSVGPDVTMLYDPQFLAELTPHDRVFVLAHELEHVRLRAHERSVTAGWGSHAFNVAHDYVINDRLRHMTGRDVPVGGLVLDDARHHAAEDLLRADFGRDVRAHALSHAPEVTHVIDDHERRELEARLGNDSASSVLGDHLPDIVDPPRMRGRVDQELKLAVVDADDPESLHRELVQRLHDAYGEIPRVRLPRSLELPEYTGPTPWAHLPLERSEARRSFRRPSRRREVGDDGLLVAGRESGRSHITVVLDVSASVIRHERALAAVRADALSRGVDAVRVVQCDGRVVADDQVAPEDLARLVIRGGYSAEVAAPPMVCDNCGRRHGWRLKWMLTDLAPALRRLDDEGCHETVLVITDGYVQIPDTAPGFDTVFVVESENRTFRPPYGTRVDMPPGGEERRG